MLEALQRVAENAVSHYALPEGVAVSMINLSENATYRVQVPDGRKWALRIHREGYHSKTAIASELVKVEIILDPECKSIIPALFPMPNNVPKYELKAPL